MRTGLCKGGEQGKSHQRIQIPQQPLADIFRMATQNMALAIQALFLQPGVKRIKAVGARGRGKKVPPGIPIVPSTLPLSFPLPGRPNLSSKR